LGEHEKNEKAELAKSPYYHYLEENENFRRWVEAIERGSIQTAANYFRKVASGSQEDCVQSRRVPTQPTFQK
jgi:hypothetical protein